MVLVGNLKGASFQFVEVRAEHLLRSALYIYKKVCLSRSNQQFFSMVTHSFLNMFLIGLYQHYLSVGCEHTLYME